MSLVVAIKQGKTIWMGGDSSITFGSETIPGKEPKVFKRDGILYGAVGASSFTNRLRLGFPTPERENMSTEEYIHIALMDTLRGFCEPEFFYDDGKKCFRSEELLIGMDGHLYQMDAALQIMECPDVFAIGEGWGRAIEIIIDSKIKDPRKLIRQTIRRLAKKINVVRPPVVIEKLEC